MASRHLRRRVLGRSVQRLGNGLVGGVVMKRAQRDHQPNADERSARSLAGERARSKGTLLMTYIELDASGQAETCQNVSQTTANWLASRLAKGKRGVFSEVVTVTPDMARALLAINEDNRGIVHLSLARWIRALRNGAWELNGETIKVSVCGHLNDGQHRLTAVAETGIEAPFVIVWGVSRESRESVDTGAKRNAGHVLGMRGAVDAILAAAATRLILNYDEGVALATRRENHEIAEAYSRLKNFEASLTAGRAVHRVLPTSKALLVAMHYIFARRHKRQADAFFAALADGTGTKDDPVTAIRNRLIQQISAKAKLPVDEVGAQMVKCFNAYVGGRRVAALRWRREGAAPEAFPSVI